MSTLLAVFRDSFAASSLDTSRWLSNIGSGGSISQSAGTLTLASGTTANAETWVLGQQNFMLPCKVMVGLQLSQRNLNHSFFIELVSVNPDTGLPDGQEQAAFLFDGTVAAQAKHQVTTGALPPNVSGTSVYTSTANPALFEIEATPDDVWFHGTVGLDNTAARVNSYKLALKAPDPSRQYRLRLRSLNGSTAPTSNTNALITLLNVTEYQEISAEVVSTRGTTSPNAGFAISNSPSVFLAPSASGAIAALQGLSINSTATTNASAVKTAASNLYEVTVNNRGTLPIAVSFYNRATAPTVGTDTPIFSIIVPANDFRSFEFGPFGKRFNTGLALAITGGTALFDNTAVAAGQVQVSLSYV
jgi:hypothetical protein